MVSVHMSYILFNGSLIASERPSLELLKTLKRKCDMVITLQSETESPEEIHQLCSELKLNWLWIPIKAVNYFLITDENLYLYIFTSLQNIKYLLTQGTRILIHCRSGVHRTGFITYNLLRLTGLSHINTISLLLKIRPIIKKRFGLHRLELSQMFYEKTQGLHPQIPYFETLNFSEHDYIKTSLFPLFWVKVLYCASIAKVSFCLTSCDFDRIVVGTEVYMKTDDEFIWKNQRNFMIKGNIKIRTAIECEDIMRGYLKSSSPKKKTKIAGMCCFLDKEFILKYMPKVLNRLDYKIVDLGTFEEIQGREICQTFSIYEDIIKYRNHVVDILEKSSKINK
ncbi:hypothetical protein SteCoe_30218 [Stentor coeruleus]|uniref:Tyrosine specific protein phosphatases domain-containing protein n=1 Tax=Stentor coeruleus TaxID=5963 RepID=A0A1R2B4E5_9CILI|nr:hypothetical protein SteCoe_30218 [Stentor coeruleus]